MKHLSVCVAQRLLVLFLLSAPLALAQSAPEIAAAREAAAQIMPKLQADDWHSSEAALQTINQLARSKEPADKKLADQLTSLCVTAIVRGIQELPQPPEQEKLLKQAESLVHLLFRHPIAVNKQRARSVIDPWEKALPDDLHARVLRLGLHMEEKNRAEQIKLAAALMDEEDLDENTRDWARAVHVEALLHGKSSAEDIQRAETVVTKWLEKQPKNIEARLRLLEIHHVKEDWPAQYPLATELLGDETLPVAERSWVQRYRLESALKLGKTNELNSQDWEFISEQLIGKDSPLKRLIDEHGQLLLGIAFVIGWLWLFLVALITRCLRARPPGFWMVVLWSTIILYASSVVLAPLAFCITFSLLGVALLIFATTGSRAPLGYLVSPQAATDADKPRWRAVLGWCVLGYLTIQMFAHGYAWAFERVIGRALETQMVAKLMQTHTLLELSGMVLAGGIFVPFLEEVIFRGILQDWVGRWLPAGWCVAVVSLLFGVIHGLEVAIPIAFIGLLLSLLRLRYRSLWPCIVLHSLNNSVLIIALYFVPELSKR
jgi:membrane protease YdiL (CAAX protease family)